MCTFGCNKYLFELYGYRLMRLDVLFAPDIAVERILCVTWNFGGHLSSTVDKGTLQERRRLRHQRNIPLVLVLKRSWMLYFFPVTWREIIECKYSSVAVLSKTASFILLRTLHPPLSKLFILTQMRKVCSIEGVRSNEVDWWQMSRQGWGVDSMPGGHAMQS